MPAQSRLTGAISLVGAQAVVLVLGYATHLWIGRVLGPAPYGIYGVVLSLQTIFGLLLTLGVPVAISRYVARDEKHAQSILRQGLRIQLIVALVVGGAVLLASPLLARLLVDVSLTPLIAFMALVIVSQSAYPMYVQYLSGMHRFNRQAALTSIYAVVKLAGALALISAFQVYGAFAGFLIGGVMAGLLGWYWTRRVGGGAEKPLPLQAFLKFAGVYVLILVGLQLLISLDLFMVKALLKDDVQAGYYNAAVTLSRISYMLLQALGFVLLPSVSKLTRPGAAQHEAATFIRDTLRYLIALIVPSVALAAATSKPLIRLFYSTNYTPAAAPLTILMVGLGALAFYLLLANIVAGAGRPAVALYLTVFLLAVSGIVGAILIPRFGLLGAAWQTTFSGLLGLLFLGMYTFRTFNIPLPLKSTINILIASALAVLPTYWWVATPLTLIPQYVVVGLFYLMVLWFMREITPADRRLVARLHPRLTWIAPR